MYCSKAYQDCVQGEYKSRRSSPKRIRMKTSKILLRNPKYLPGKLLQTIVGLIVLQGQAEQNLLERDFPSLLQRRMWNYKVSYVQTLIYECFSKNTPTSLHSLPICRPHFLSQKITNSAKDFIILSKGRKGTLIKTVRYYHNVVLCDVNKEILVRRYRTSDHVIPIRSLNSLISF